VVMLGQLLPSASQQLQSLNHYATHSRKKFTHTQKPGSLVEKCRFNTPLVLSSAGTGINSEQTNASRTKINHRTHTY